jgi:hypothetical protein
MYQIARAPRACIAATVDAGVSNPSRSKAATGRAISAVVIGWSSSHCHCRPGAGIQRLPTATGAFFVGCGFGTGFAVGFAGAFDVAVGFVGGVDVADVDPGVADAVDAVACDDATVAEDAGAGEIGPGDCDEAITEGDEAAGDVIPAGDEFGAPVGLVSDESLPPCEVHPAIATSAKAPTTIRDRTMSLMSPRGCAVSQQRCAVGTQ